MAEQRPPRSLETPQDQQFWEYCAKEELRLQRCGKCNHMVFPPVHPCEMCGSEDQEWEKLSGRGKLVSWCSIERDYYQGALPIPWDTIMVELEEGAVFLSNPKGFANADAAYEMPVKVSFIDCEDEHGAYKLPVFERA